MYSLAHSVSHTLEIRKSRFIGCVEPIADRPHALERVAELHEQLLSITRGELEWQLVDQQ